LLFCGTETGLYLSIDYGSTWTKWKNGYPAVSTMDLAIQPIEHDLVIGTFGRSAYILDDIRPLRALAQQGAKLLEKPIVAFATPTGVLASYKQAAGIRFAGNAMFVGDNRPNGVGLSFSVGEIKFNEKNINKDNETTASTKTATKSLENDKKITPKDTLKVTIEILDEKREIIRTLKATPKLGLNRIQWAMNRKGLRNPNAPENPDAPEPGGLQVLPGTYTVRYIYGKDKDSTQINIIADPREKMSLTEMKANDDLAMRVQKQREQALQAIKNLDDAKKTVELISKELKGDDEAIKALKKQAQGIQDSIKVLKEMISGKEGMQGIFRSEDNLNARIGAAAGYMEISSDMPNSTQTYIFKQAEAEAKVVLTKVNQFFEKDWKAFQKAVEESKFSIFKPIKPLKID
jgi:hypothetical protein